MNFISELGNTMKLSENVWGHQDLAPDRNTIFSSVIHNLYSQLFCVIEENNSNSQMSVHVYTWNVSTKHLSSWPYVHCMIGAIFCFLHRNAHDRSVLRKCYYYGCNKTAKKYKISFILLNYSCIFLCNAKLR